ncbi:PqqD family protein [Clostridium sp. JS66]|uniref:PqqD family protein n=1 Tax=Clostridium sp. JS66 TaxID=3064705 RepID=UPI00298DCA55|nr:PqqD family protein [Clostridium sp. JS66]WPC42609.1 PqqD family protein [Clostridium sp. JS66]
MLDFKPCRVIQSYKIENNKASIIGFNHVVELNSVSTVLWKMSNGKNTVKDIITEILNIFDISDENKVYDDIKKLIDMLHNEGLLIKNWDPLYKDKIGILTRGN